MNVLKRYWQIIYAVILIVLVPILIVVNTVFVVEGFKRDTDAALQRQALTVGRMFNLAAQDALSSPEKLQTLVDGTSKQAVEVSALDVLVPDGQTLPSERFRIVASRDPAAIGASSSQVQDVLSWTQDEAFAFLTRSDSLSSADQGSPRAGSVRYWAVIMPLHDAAGKEQALLFMKFSLATFDDLVASTLFRSYLLLALTVLVTVLVLASNTRLFQYAVLFRKLKEVDTMKDEFISMASHELMAPISALKGFLSLFLENAFGPFQGVAREKMQVLFTISERLGELVEDLLNVSRIEQGRLKIEPVPTQPEDVIRLAMGELESAAQKKQLAFAFTPAAAHHGRSRPPRAGAGQHRRQRRQVHADRFRDRHGLPGGRARQDQMHRHRRGHVPDRARTPVREVLPHQDGRDREHRGHRPRPVDHQAAGRAPERQDLRRFDRERRHAGDRRFPRLAVR